MTETENKHLTEMQHSQNNQIAAQGADKIGEALMINNTLRMLNLEVRL